MLSTNSCRPVRHLPLPRKPPRPREAQTRPVGGRRLLRRVQARRHRNQVRRRTTSGRRRVTKRPVSRLGTTHTDSPEENEIAGKPPKGGGDTTPEGET